MLGTTRNATVRLGIAHSATERLGMQRKRSERNGRAQNSTEALGPQLKGSEFNGSARNATETLGMQWKGLERLGTQWKRLERKVKARKQTGRFFETNDNAEIRHRNQTFRSYNFFISDLKQVIIVLKFDDKIVMRTGTTLSFIT